MFPSSLSIRDYFADVVIHPTTRLIVALHRNIRQQARDEELDADEGEEDADKRPEAFRE